ncbi:GNAT family N-acetyltransferase [Acinetobacter schindleri]|nr:GNAT family N-acetyltransferase [Acinetobacter schindleri]MCO8067209.1 GNAT family N-acetyltransferase [Acinetobacter schindleri]
MYFSHLLVHPELQVQGIGRRIMQAMLEALFRISSKKFS